ncbi:apolipoprotein N-acyltransferase [bacterium]|nr:apolipoprotein N-acyltransferase [bacterium]
MSAPRQTWWRRVVSVLPSVAEISTHRAAFAWAALSGLVLRLAFQPMHWSFVTLVMLVPLFWGLRRCPPKMAFWAGLLFGTIYGLWGVGWTTIVARFNPMIYAGVLPAAMWWGLHQAVALAAIVYTLRRVGPWVGLVAAMAIWWGMEYFRSVGRIALPIGLVGHGMAGWPEMAQLASIGGVPMIGALIIGVNLTIMECIAVFRAGYGHAGALLRLATMIALVVAGHIYGSRVIADTEARYAGEDSFPVRVAMVQTGIDQMEKFNSYANEDPAVRSELQQKIYASLVEQLGTVERSSVDLVITPESSLTHDLVDIDAGLQRRLTGNAILPELLDWVNDVRIPLVVGGVDNLFADVDGNPTESVLEGIDSNNEFHPGRRVYGALWLLRPGDDSVSPTATYRKSQLMPFGEEVPYLDIIPGFQEKVVQIGAFAKGPLVPPTGMWVQHDALEPRNELRLGFSICFEDLIPRLHRHYAVDGTQLYVNTTNDAWFDGSSGPGWHFEMARWRSIENRVPMARCTNSGVTAIVSPTGKVLESLPVVEKGILSTTVRVVRSPGRTLYGRIGDLPGLLCFLGSLALLMGLRKTKTGTAE